MIMSNGISTVGELLLCKPLELKAAAFALFDILNHFINEANIELDLGSR